ncbi:hypothetical protein A9Q84_10735 [Halobacteriovorax marinus]|uniref:Polyketide cyclase n=1 Tax=Halobacteriovorax marinus TaxID=97084 RepID=A0A1Y5F7C1_9BACT|nr:hypothetical protein A9Q84_10735 [Halobacteriovorax marinus]
MKLKHSITINSPLASVWSTTVDVNNWNKWTPTIETSSLNDESFSLGSSATIKQPDMAESIWTITQFEDKESFTWETSVPGLKMIASHRLVEVNPNETTNILILEVKGLLSFILWPILKGKIRNSLEKENEGLKSFCEQR